MIFIPESDEENNIWINNDRLSKENYLLYPLHLLNNLTFKFMSRTVGQIFFLCCLKIRTKKTWFWNRKNGYVGHNNKTRKAQKILIASVCLSVWNQIMITFVWNQNLVGREGSAKRSRKTKFGPTFYVLYLLKRKNLRSKFRRNITNFANSPTNFVSPSAFSDVFCFGIC